MENMAQAEGVILRPPVKIAPSLLSADFGRLAEEAQEILESGADWLHLDIMDGHFVDNLTFGPPVVAHLREHVPNGFLDCHLMVTDPQKWFRPLLNCGVNQIIFHVETQDDASETSELIGEIKNHGNGEVRAGIAIKPNTPLPLDDIKTWVEDDGLDYVLIMTVEPGFGGQDLIPSTLEKVKQLRAALPELDIGVDGGVKLSNVGECAKVGANVIISGSGIFGQMNRGEIISEMRRIVMEAQEALYRMVISPLQNLGSYFNQNPRMVVLMALTGLVCYGFLSNPGSCQLIRRYYDSLRF